MHQGPLQELWSTVTTERLFDSSNIGFIVIDPEMRIIDASDQFCRMLGYTRPELTSLTILDITPPDEIRVSAARHMRSISGEHIPPFDKRYLHKSGEARWTRVHNQPVLDSDGKLIYWLAMLEDISQRKQDEVVLEQMAAITEASDDAIFRSSLNHEIEFWGKGAERLYGYKAEEVIGKHASILTGDLSPERTRTVEQKIRSGSAVFSASSLGRHKDGHGIPISVKVFPIKNPKGSIIAFAATHRDLSELKAMENQLLHAQRMETAGLLAGGVAHDFNNILTVVLGSCTLLREHLTDNATGLSQLDMIARAASRATRLTRQLLAFSSQQTVSPVLINPNQLLAEAFTMLKSTIGEDIRIMSSLQSRSTIIMDPTQMEQLVLNLSINARHAMPKGGNLTISTYETDYQEEPVFNEVGTLSFLPAPIAPGNYLVLSVKDTGSGIDAATLEHIFDPFFTTKDKGAGTGLGLSVVYGIVNQCNGGIRVVTRPQGGTEFQILIPVTDGLPAEPGIDNIDTAPAGLGTIAVIEDNDDVRNLTVTILQSAGYQIIEYANPRQLLDNKPDFRIDLIISDVVMPEMSGPAFAEIWLQHHPEASILFISGYFDESTFPPRLTEQKLLMKPFKPGELLKLVAEILSA